jgi:RNA polymerase sigma factor (sigma-70 family)
MHPQLEDIKSEMEKALKSLEEQKGNEIAIRIRPILYTNLDRGRLQDYIEGEISRVDDYVWRVEDKYLHLSVFIKDLQTDRVESVWAPLFEQMCVWANNFLRRKSFFANITTQEIALGCATEAAINLLHAYFPYDTDFEPWVHVIVQNACRKFIQKETRKSTIPQQDIIESDDVINELIDPTGQDPQYLLDSEKDLWEDVGKLSLDRRQVIEYEYVHGLSPNEIALKMGKSIGAIYSLKFNALQDLRKILVKTRDNLNE